MFSQQDTLALLFTADRVTSLPCRCYGRGYCPKHGTYEPATNDPEVQSVLAEASRPRNAGVRVIRKRLSD